MNEDPSIREASLFFVFIGDQPTWGLFFAKKRNKANISFPSAAKVEACVEKRYRSELIMGKDQCKNYRFLVNFNNSAIEAK